jgi:hypothetical protein
MAVGYKIFDRKRGKPNFLFHGNEGTKTVPLGQWRTATARPIHCHHTGRFLYTSGFHIFPSMDVAFDYLMRFTNVAVKSIAVVVYEDAVPKPTNSDVLLAKRMMLLTAAWDGRLDITSRNHLIEEQRSWQNSLRSTRVSSPSLVIPGGSPTSVVASPGERPSIV